MTTSQLAERQRSAIRRIAALVLVNAMMFQEVLAQKNERVRPLQDFRHESDPVSAFADHWKFILDDINYYPIFNVAYHLIRCISSDKDSTNAIQHLIGVARQIVDWRASLRHDLAGRIYHRILAEAKYLGAYYTSIPAAAMLAKLALRPSGWSVNWADVDTIGQLHMADLACGTGTLLMATADAITDNHIYAAIQSAKKPQLAKLHEVVNEHVLIGFDVLHSAVHLTASTLALRVPDVELNLTNLTTLPFAEGHDELGSLEFFPTDTVTAASLFAQHPERVLGKGPVKGPVTLPKLDLCIMNPPFTSSRQPNLLFGSIPEKDRAAMQKKLKNLVKDEKIPASVTAGLAAVFVALGDKYLKPGGRLALVLPRSILSGVAWERTRTLLETAYQVECVIVSHEPDHWNFSENTDLSEVLIVARKLIQGKATGQVTFVNLWRNPKSTVHALALTRSIQQCNPPDVHHLKGPANLMVGTAKFGEAVAISQEEMKGSIWVFPCAFAQSELLRTFYALKRGEVVLPGHKECHEIPVCSLEKLGGLGPDPRDVYDGFALTDAKTAYPALWGHPSGLATFAQKPNQYLDPLSEALPGRNLRDTELLWPKAGRVLITMRSWLKTKRMVAVRMSERVLSDVWWPFVLKKTGLNETQAEKALVLWLNSTLGILMLLAHREETRGAWVQFKKPVLSEMPVLDLTRLSSHTLADLADAYDTFHSAMLLPLPEMGTDPTRAKVDAAICKALKLPAIDTIRQLLGQEPLITLDIHPLVQL